MRPTLIAIAFVLACGGEYEHKPLDCVDADSGWSWLEDTGSAPRDTGSPTQDDTGGTEPSDTAESSDTGSAPIPGETSDPA
jgi:hypothetical protein